MTIDVNTLADELLAAYKEGAMVTPPASRDPEFDLKAAYAVEVRLVKLRAAAGARVVGRKVGYANKALWRVLKLETLMWAHMYDDTVQFATAGQATLNLDRMRSPKIEPEIVLGLRETPSGDSSDAAAALQSVEWLAIGFEIIDCPYPDWKYQPADFVASFGLHAGLIVGERQPVKPEQIPILVEQLPRATVRVFRNDEFVEEGSGKNSLRSPALCLAELARATVQAGAEPLAAGEMISSGTLTGGHFIGRGETWRVDVQELALPGLVVKTT